MKKYLFLFILAISLITIAASAATKYILGPEEYLVYATLIDDWYVNDQSELAVIRGRTALHRSRFFLAKELAYVKDGMPELEQSTVNDFVAKNLESYPLDAFVNQRADYKLLSQEEINHLFHLKDGWIKFYEKYPDSNGILTFSRVGFNLDKQQALVYVANQWDSFSGAGIYVLLEKNYDDSWDIIQELSIWNSWIFD